MDLATNNSTNYETPRVSVLLLNNPHGHPIPVDIMQQFTGYNLRIDMMDATCGAEDISSTSVGL